ncbi:MAG TPA: L-histidine N(alpha)-methyltransferase [Pyrinomonadaceae bacterium]|nr:L-histidine N(alpha)-methyltransferase [Pyrinomonadaceae bacterium]
MSQPELSRIHEDRLIINDLVKRDPLADFAEDVRRGLTAPAKHLFPKYLYDELGSQLFEAICLLPEYYLTRAENQILAQHAEDIIRSIEMPNTLIEMGSGSASKTRLVIETLLREQSDLLFVPVDISASALERSSRVLLQSYPELRIEAYAAEYFDGLAELAKRKRGRTLALFLGSNISNFEPSEAKAFLRSMRIVLAQGDALLLGADLRKERSILEAAYNDSLGVTAAFSRNLLVRINGALDADFDLPAFRHRAIFNETDSRIEIYVESLRPQTVTIRKLQLRIDFDEGERIHTENSYKYDLESIKRLALETGFECSRTWFDDQRRFSSNLLMAA